LQHLAGIVGQRCPGNAMDGGFLFAVAGRFRSGRIAKQLINLMMKDERGFGGFTTTGGRSLLAVPLPEFC
jgi:hypothetical protein